jgi:hypothetical protein
VPDNRKGKNTAIFLLAAAVVALGIFAYSRETSLRELTERVDHASRKASLELQEKCARQARQDFTQLGWDKDSWANFSNHYNERLNKCFVLIESTDAKTVPGTIFQSKHLEDAFEGKVFGDYSWHTQEGKKYWEVPPSECTVTLPSREQKVCNSSEEFDELIRTYMYDGVSANK